MKILISKLKQRSIDLQSMIDKNTLLIERSNALLAKGRVLQIKQPK